MAVSLMSDLDLSGRRILIREDLNVPIKNNLISSDARIQAALPTIRQALSVGAQVIICLTWEGLMKALSILSLV